jgi:hypothetical protein
LQITQSPPMRRGLWGPDSPVTRSAPVSTSKTMPVFSQFRSHPRCSAKRPKAEAIEPAFASARQFRCQRVAFALSLPAARHACRMRRAK